MVFNGFLPPQTGVPEKAIHYSSIRLIHPSHEEKPENGPPAGNGVCLCVPQERFICLISFWRNLGNNP